MTDLTLLFITAAVTLPTLLVTVIAFVFGIDWIRSNTARKEAAASVKEAREIRDAFLANTDALEQRLKSEIGWEFKSGYLGSLEEEMKQRFSAEQRVYLSNIRQYIHDQTARGMRLNLAVEEAKLAFWRQRGAVRLVDQGGISPEKALKLIDRDQKDSLELHRLAAGGKTEVSDALAYLFAEDPIPLPLARLVILLEEEGWFDAIGIRHEILSYLDRCEGIVGNIGVTTKQGAANAVSQYGDNDDGYG